MLPIQVQVKSTFASTVSIIPDIVVVSNIWYLDTVSQMTWRTVREGVKLHLKIITTFR
jgi:hypothetical protein